MWPIRTFFVFIYLFFFGSSVVAQQDSRDTTYVRDFKNIFNLRAIGQFRPMALHVQNRENRESIVYRPNSRPLIGLGGTIVNIGFSLLVKLPESYGRDPDVYGDTRFNDFQLNWYQGKFTFDFQYQYYQGLYVSRINLPDVSYEQIIQKPDLALEGFGLNGVYLFNQDDFSYIAAFNNTNRQLRSSGTFVAMASLKLTRLKAGGTLVPERYENDFGSSPHFREGEFTGFSIMPGYAQTFVRGKFYLNLVLAVGPDLQYNELSLPSGSEYNWKVKGKMNLRAGLGYDNGKIFTGIFYQQRRNNFSVGDLIVVHDASLIRFSVGHRFPETSWMQDIRNWRLYEIVMNPFKEILNF